MSRANGFLGLPERAPKPRDHSLTHVMDKGLSLVQIEGMFDTAGDYIDIVKLGWGTSYVTGNLADNWRSIAPTACRSCAAARCSRRPRRSAASTRTARG